MLDIRRIPIGALFGLILTAMFLLAAIFGPWMAPFGDTEIVGDVWPPCPASSCSAPTISAAISCHA